MKVSISSKINVILVLAMVALPVMFSSCHQREEANDLTAIKRFERDHNDPVSTPNIVYVDTHDNYDHSHSAEPVDQNMFGKYFSPLKNGKKAFNLTFDCAWVEENNGMEILDTLKENNIRVTFFISGPFIFNDFAKGLAGGLRKESFKMIKRIVDDGHLIGNHTQTHPHLAAKPNPNWAKEVSELKSGWEAVVADIYGRNPPANAKMSPFWRAPFGEYDEASLTTAACNGFPYHIGWNIDVVDTAGRPNCAESSASDCWDGDKMVKRILDFSELNKWSLSGTTVLAHLSNYYRWGNNLSTLIKTLKAKGFQFTTVDEVFAFPQGDLLSPDSPVCKERL